MQVHKELLERVQELYPDFDINAHLEELIRRKDSKKDVFKVVLVGDGGVGKSSYMRALRGHSFTPVYEPTVGVELHAIKLHSNRGTITLNIWDVAGQDKFRGLDDAYYITADAVIIMSSYDSKHSVGNRSEWHRTVKRVADVPTLYVMNKADISDKPVSKRYIQRHGIIPISISSKDKSHIFDPLISLARTLTNDNELSLVV